MRSYHFTLPRAVYRRFGVSPFQFTEIIETILEHGKCNAVTKDMLASYIFNNKQYMKKIHVEVVIQNNRTVQNLYHRSRVIECDVSQLLTIMIDTWLCMQDVSYKGVGYKLRRIFTDTEFDVYTSTMFPESFQLPYSPSKMVQDQVVEEDQEVDKKSKSKKKKAEIDLEIGGDLA